MQNRLDEQVKSNANSLSPRARGNSFSNSDNEIRSSGEVDLKEDTDSNNNLHNSATNSDGIERPKQIEKREKQREIMLLLVHQSIMPGCIKAEIVANVLFPTARLRM